MNDPTLPHLAELQRRFQRHLMGGDAEVARVVVDSERVPVATRLKVYSDAYRVRLIEALGSNYPRLEQLIGKEAFAEVALRYLDRHPSTNRSVRWFGHRLPEMLREMHTAEPWFADLASLEWMLAGAFDAPNDDVASVEALSQIPPDRWSNLRFELHASTQHLVLESNAPTLFKALSAEQPADEARLLDKPQRWLIWRQDLTPQYRSIGASEAAALDTIVAGGTFADVCEVLCDWHAEDQVPLAAAGLLKSWMSDGLIARLRLEDETS